VQKRPETDDFFFQTEPNAAMMMAGGRNNQQMNGGNNVMPPLPHMHQMASLVSGFGNYPGGAQAKQNAVKPQESLILMESPPPIPGQRMTR